MNLFLIAWRNLQHRKLPSCLTLLSMSLGVSLVVLVLVVSSLIDESFRRSSNVGYNIVVGPTKGSAMQLTFSCVLFNGDPIQSTLPYSYYMEYLPGEERQKEFARLGGTLNDPDRAGKYGLYTKTGFAIPMCIGDYVGPFRVVATTPDYLEKLQSMEGKPYPMASGRNFKTDSEEHGFFECVLGATVAQDLEKKVGDVVKASHGVASGVEHEDGFTVVGILAPTGTANDRVAIINIEGFYLLEGHEAVERDEDTGLEIRGAPMENGMKKRTKSKPMPTEKRQLSAILVKVNGNLGIGLPMQINRTKVAMAASPVQEITRLQENFLQPAKLGLMILTTIICVVSAISILVGMYNSMSERTRDIAVMRALGASRDRVLLVTLGESLLISLGGGILGWLVAHLMAVAASPAIESRTGVRISFFDVSMAELMIIPGLILIGVFAGLLPAIIAYRTDVSRSLAS